MVFGDDLSVRNPTDDDMIRIAGDREVSAAQRWRAEFISQAAARTMKETLAQIDAERARSRLAVSPLLASGDCFVGRSRIEADGVRQ